MASFLDPKSKFQDSELIQMDNKLRGKKVGIPQELGAVDALGSDSGGDEESEGDEEGEDEETDGEDDDASDGSQDTPSPSLKLLQTILKTIVYNRWPFLTIVNNLLQLFVQLLTIVGNSRWGGTRQTRWANPLGAME